MIFRLLLLTITIGLFCSAPALAEPADSRHPTSANLDMRYFSMLPVLNEGRIKPMDTFARVTLKRYAGQDHTATKKAIEWLAQSVFEPASASEEPIFYIANAQVRHELGLIERPKPLYSYAELAPGLKKTYEKTIPLMKKDQKQLSAFERDFLQIHENSYEFTQIMRSFSLLLPLNVDLPEKWQKKLALSPESPITYLDLSRISQDLQSEVKTLIRKKGVNLKTYNTDEGRIALLTFQIKTLSEAAEGNNLLRVIPSPWKDDTDIWHAPWDLLSRGQGSPESAAFMDKWKSLAIAYQSSDRQQWATLSQQIYAADLANQPSLTTWRLPLENLYNIFKPFDASSGLYAVGFLLVLGFLISGFRPLYWASALALSTGFALHGLGLLTRMILLGRPPVSTLYESILFVGFVCLGIGALIEYRTKNGIGLIAASVSGIFLGLMATSLVGDADPLKVLTAVLNTQFWLATHVLCITFGYGWCVIAGIMAHGLLIGRVTHRLDDATTQNMMRILGHISQVSLLFTAVGTILGGVWADQSWGRFWGWDPKENGALLIVLWLVWLVHGKLAAQITPLLWVAGLAFLNVVVATAWIGVNLLGVGLHSYGFTEGLFWGLGVFSALETLLIGSLFFILARRSERISYAH